jgi:hypothetical protein
LLALCYAADSSGPVHIQPYIAFLEKPGLAGVEAHPYPHGYALGPRVARQGTLCCQRGLECKQRLFEDSKASIPRRIDFLSVPVLKSRPQQPALRSQHVRIRRAAEMQQKLRRALNVAEK